jgi:hypothetical protein
VVKFFKEGMHIAGGCYYKNQKQFSVWRSSDPVKDKRRINVVYIPTAVGRAKQLSFAIPFEGEALPLEQRKFSKCPPRLTIDPDGKVLVCGGRWGCAFTCLCEPSVPFSWPLGDLDDPDEIFDEVFKTPWKTTV